MKRLMMIALAVFAFQTVACADNDKIIDVKQLPQNAQEFLQKHFAQETVAVVKMDTEILDKSYEVIFSTGNKVEFAKNGDWKDIDCTTSVVPAETVPAEIANYVKTKYPDTKILKIEKDKYSYEIELSNRWELEFDKKFNLIDIDR